MKYVLECRYCGFITVQTLSSWEVKQYTCIKCNDKKVKIKPVETINVFGYDEEKEEKVTLEDYTDFYDSSNGSD